MRCIEEIQIFRVLSTKNNKGLFKQTRKYMIGELEKTGLKTKDIDELLRTQMSKHYFTEGEQFSIPSKEAYTKLQTTGFFKMKYENLKKNV